MYRRNNEGRTGVTRRDPKHWRPFHKGLHWGSDADVDVALDARGKPAGYIVFHRSHNTAVVIEAGFRTRKVLSALLRRAAERAWERRLESVELRLPEDDALVEHCIPFGLNKRVRYAADGGAMVRMIDVQGALHAIADELVGRIRMPGQLNLRTNLGGAGLFWEPDVLGVGDPLPNAPTLRLPQWALAQLLYGYRSADALAGEGIVRGPKAGISLLRELLPVHPHYQFAVDHF
jgi:predicted acetyltransferase